MNNTQTAILLRQYAARLHSAMDEIRSALPASMIEESTGFLGNKQTRIPCMGKMEELYGDLCNDIAELTAANNET